MTLSLPIVGLYLATGLSFGALIHSMNVEEFRAEGVTKAERTEAFLHLYGLSLVLWPLQLAAYLGIRVFFAAVRRLP
tara:strand:- start:9945 stop:10175 length:231 start_codon:yes stop_codon:yes gene_type:complete